MYNIMKIHTPSVAHQGNFVEITILSSIPTFLKEAITLTNHKLVLDNVEGCKIAPLGSVIGYEKSDYTASGYNCWSIGQVGFDLEKVDDVFYTKEKIITAMPIPTPDKDLPMWVRHCNLIYNDDGTVTLESNKGNMSGRIGIDFLLCHGLKTDGNPEATILTPDDPAYYSYMVCNNSGEESVKLCELYPA